MNEGSTGVREAGIPQSETEPQKVTRKLLTRRGLKKIFKRNLETARQESEIDELTSLPNLRAFNRRLREEADRIKRFGGQGTVVVLDADKLKKINDTKGHEAGNDYLKSIANALREGTRRDIDFVSRTGGDEFILILPGTGVVGAEKMWTESLNPSFVKNGIAISGGAAPINPTNPFDAKEKADSAMYGAKKEPTRNGENLLFSYIPGKNG